VLKGLRLAQRGLPRELAAPFAVGLTAATLSTLTSRRLLERMENARSYLPLAAYRVALGAIGLARLPRRHRPPRTVQ
nr:hypothetical protein [Thermoleophilaceae bacterium]